jgi:predicted secreted protein
MAKLLGKHLVVEWDPTGADPVVAIQTFSRNFSVKQSGNKIDVSTRSDIAAGAKDTLADAPDRTAELSGLDEDADAPDWEGLAVGDTGTLTWYRRGKIDGRAMCSASATVTGVEFGSPHDNANDWKITWELTSAISIGTYDAP